MGGTRARARRHPASLMRPIDVLHVTRHCHIGSTGGTERYIRELVRELAILNISSRILWITDAYGEREPFVDEGITIVPLAPTRELPSRVAHLVSEQRPTLLHFHTLGTAEREI